MSVKKILSLLCIIVMVSLLFGCLTIEKSTTARRGGGAKIEIIEGWELKDDARTSKGQIACIKPVGKDLPQVDFHTSVSLEDTGGDLTAKAFLQIFIDAFKKQGATVVSEEDAVMGGMQAKRMTVTYGDKMSQFTVVVHWERPFWMITTALASEFDTYTADFEKLANNVTYYPLTEEQGLWIKLEGEPLGVIKSPLGDPEDLDHIGAAGFAEDWDKDGTIDGIAIAIDFIAKDQQVGKIIGWHNTRIVVDVKLTRTDTNKVVYHETHYGIDWQDFPVASDPPESCWIPKDKIKDGFDPAKDMGKFVMDIKVRTEKQGEFTYKDENCPHKSKRAD